MHPIFPSDLRVLLVLALLVAPHNYIGTHNHIGTQNSDPEGGGRETSISGVHGGVPRIRVIFSRKKSLKSMSIF